MRTKYRQKNRAIALRRRGLSYREIKKHISVSKSSLSLWLRNIQLTSIQRKRLEELNTAGQKAGAKARHEQRLKRTVELTKEVKQELPALLTDPFFTLGLALYWAEGSKQKPWNIAQPVVIGNTDQDLILLMRRWFQRFTHVRLEDFGYRLHIHESAKTEEACRQWSQILNIAPQDIRITLKKHRITTRHVGKDYKGLMNLRVYKSTWLNRRMNLWTDGAAKYFQ